VSGPIGEQPLQSRALDLRRRRKGSPKGTQPPLDLTALAPWDAPPEQHLGHIARDPRDLGSTQSNPIGFPAVGMFGLAAFHFRTVRLAPWMERDQRQLFSSITLAQPPL
jgi:hypothetical protein